MKTGKLGTNYPEQYFLSIWLSGVKLCSRTIFHIADIGEGDNSWNASYIVEASLMDFYSISFAVKKDFPWQAEITGHSSQLNLLPDYG
jgi:hypothetical protein